MTGDLPKRRMLIDLTEEQYNTIKCMAASQGVPRARIMRNLLDMLSGVDADASLVLYDSQRIRMLTRMRQLVEQASHKSTTTDLSMCLTYSKEKGVNVRWSTTCEEHVPRSDRNV